MNRWDWAVVVAMMTTFVFFLAGLHAASGHSEGDRYRREAPRERRQTRHMVMFLAAMSSAVAGMFVYACRLLVAILRTWL